MPVDAGIYGQFAQPVRSIGDVEQQQAQLQLARQNMLMGQADLANMPLRNQMLQLQYATGQLANQRQQQQMQLVQSIINGDPNGQAAMTANASQNALAGGGGPTVTNAASMNNALAGPQNSGVPGMPGLNYRNMVALKVAGGADMSKDFQMGMEGFSHPAAQYVTDVNGNTKYLVDPNNPVTIDPATGAVSMAPGGAATIAAKAAATKAGQNTGDLLPLGYVGRRPDGSLGPIGGSIADYLGGGTPGGTAMPPPAQMIPPPAGQFGPGAGVVPVSQQMPDTGQGSPAGALAAIDQEIARTPRSSDAYAILQAERAKIANGTSSSLTPQPAQPTQQHWDSLQAEVDAAKAAGPAGIAALQAKYQPMIQNIQDPAKRAAATDFFNGATGSPVNTPLQGRPQLASQADISAQNITAENKAQLATKPALEQATAMATDTGKAAVDYRGELDKGVDSMFALMQRNQALKPLLAQFQTGGLLPDQRNTIANTIQNMEVLPDDLKAKLSSWVSSGDPAIGKTIAYSLAGEGIQNMFQTLGTTGAKPNRAEFVQMNKTKLGLDSGNLPITLAMQQQEQAYRSLLSEQQALNTAQKNGTFDPNTWRADYSANRDASLFGSGTAPSGAAIAAPPQLPTKSGFKYLGKQ